MLRFNQQKVKPDNLSGNAADHEDAEGNNVFFAGGLSLARNSCERLMIN